MANFHQNIEVQEQTYDKFRDFVHKNLRKGLNTNVDTKAFSELNPNLHGPTHMCIGLENVQEGNEYLYTKVKEYHKDSKIKEQDNIGKSGFKYVAYVPYYVIEKKSKSGYFKNTSSSSHGCEAPNSYWLMLYIVFVFLLIIVGILKTNRSDWKFLF
jgi:hypothetical protein